MTEIPVAMTRPALLVCLVLFFSSSSCRRDQITSSPEPAFSLDESRLATLEAMPDDHPVILMKLLKFKDGDGRQLYESYLSSVLPLIQDLGGEFLFLGKAKPYEIDADKSHELFGLEANPWDLLVFERLPSRKDLRKLMESEIFQAAESELSKHLEDSALYALNGTLYKGEIRSSAETVVAPEYPDGEELFELNLLRFKPDGGEESYYGDYAREVLPMIREVGAKVLYGLKPEVMLKGEEAYDRAVLVMYPSQEAFEGMISSDEYRAISPYRENALEVGHLFGFRNAGGGVKELRKGQ